MVNPRRINLDEQAQAGSLTSDIIADGAVTGLKIAAGAVDSNAIAPDAVIESKIADGAVTANKIANGAITANKLAPGAVDAGSILDGSISAIKLDSDVFGLGLVPNGVTNAIDVNVDGATLEIISDVLQVKTIDQSNINISGSLNFNNNQALALRLENLASDPTAGNPGRLIWRTDLLQVKVDDGTSFVTLAGGGGGHVIEDEAVALPQRAVLNFVGTGVTVTDTGSKTQVSIPGGGAGSFDKFLNTVTNPVADKTITLANTPVSNSEVVAWNGLILKPGATNDYTISSNVITLNAGITLTVGDELLVVYAF